MTIFVNINNQSGEANTQRMAESQQRESAGVVQGQTQRQRSNPRGRNKRKSYTVDFIKKTLDLLDDKYKTVAKQQGVNRSLVIKREKTKAKFLQN